MYNNNQYYIYNVCVREARTRVHVLHAHTHTHTPIYIYIYIARRTHPQLPTPTTTAASDPGSVVMVGTSQVVGRNTGDCIQFAKVCAATTHPPMCLLRHFLPYFQVLFFRCCTSVKLSGRVQPYSKPANFRRRID